MTRGICLYDFPNMSHIILSLFGVTAATAAVVLSTGNHVKLANPLFNSTWYW